MGFLDDLGSGDFGAAASDALGDVGSFLGSVGSTVLSVFSNKSAAQAVRASAPPSTFPRLGMGYGATPVRVNMADNTPIDYSTAGTMVPSTSGNAIVDRFLGGLGFNYGADVTQGVPGTSAPSLPRMRRPAIVVDQYGRLCRPLGRPMLWSGDLAAAKRVFRVAGKLGRFHRHRSSGYRRRPR